MDHVTSTRDQSSWVNHEDTPRSHVGPDAGPSGLAGAHEGADLRPAPLAPEQNLRPAPRAPRPSAPRASPGSQRPGHPVSPILSCPQPMPGLAS